VGLELFLFLDENPRVGCTCRLRAAETPSRPLAAALAALPLLGATGSSEYD
jgi:hypothetical protein